VDDQPTQLLAQSLQGLVAMVVLVLVLLLVVEELCLRC
jgi:hypothetical protein